MPPIVVTRKSERSHICSLRSAISRECDIRHRGTGVGRELVRFAERWGREQGMDTMQLEVLVPRQWAHPSKEFLKAWYTRVGYRPVRTGQFEESYPELAPLLATPCDFVIYHKDLPASP
jgi:Acetyltransferase (GNAT) family